MSVEVIAGVAGMNIVNVHQAKTNLSKLIEQVEAGEEVVIARAGKPVVRLVVFTPPVQVRRAGTWRGQVKMAEDFDVLPESLLAAFEGRES